MKQCYNVNGVDYIFHNSKVRISSIQHFALNRYMPHPKVIGININFDIHLPYCLLLFIFLKGDKGCFDLRTIIGSCIFFCFVQNPHNGNGYNSNHFDHLEHFDHNGHLRWWWWTFWWRSQWSSSSHWMSFSLVCKNLSKISTWQNSQD
jgi:hypothetical protein